MYLNICLSFLHPITNPRATFQNSSDPLRTQVNLLLIQNIKDLARTIINLSEWNMKCMGHMLLPTFPL